MTHQTAIYPSLRNKVVFITGGATGIGAEYVSAFSRQGAKVGFIDRDSTGAAELIKSLDGSVPHAPYFIQCDVTDISALQSAIRQCSEHIGDIEVLINNVANDVRHDFNQIDAAFFDSLCAVNLRPHIFASQSVLPGMRRLGHGSIINVGSIGWLRKNGAIAVYGALKSAAMGLTKSLARDLGKDRIRINHLVPGWTMTEKQKKMWVDEAAEKAIKEGQCLPDKIQPSDLAATALFLAADDSRMITSRDFVVDGGWT